MAFGNYDLAMIAAGATGVSLTPAFVTGAISGVKKVKSLLKETDSNQEIGQLWFRSGNKAEVIVIKGE